ncbi:nucleotidyltransferase domain-containing protein [Cyanobacterium aponinum UTEX 3221]|uniref:DNA polymerase subunit beta n=1 Tax=Cyanobacterium aponinum 0216 TaxID=2676140 RepID=A0A844GQP9_9CHRO|nr:nucleotidyltransferase domain-containing protein [Cyanobacterium aponinum]MTF37873.1 DNA polymerase subunit beta [Cyanobacterium aponinum 0216]WRL38939.1 nucleotidyltransferase domain-containing protein [Cyanobacterium aponinum UTEX 3221]
MTTTLNRNFNIPLKKIAEFCHKWEIIEFAVFGSILRDDFSSDSDIDCLVKFSENSYWSLFDRVKMKEELALILNRKVDLVNRKSIENSENWLREQEILKTNKVIYVKE